MNFNLSEEQQMLKDSIQKFVKDNYELVNRLEQQKSGSGYSEDHWRTFAELGWLSLPFAEEFGGFGGTATDMMVVMEELGKGLVLEPFYATIVLAGSALSLFGTQKQKEDMIPKIIAGEVKATVAYSEHQARYNLADTATTATKTAEGYVIHGQKSLVWNAETSDYIIVSARTSGDRTDESGITLFVVKADSAGVSAEHYPTVDGLRASEVTLENVKVTASDIVGELDQGIAILNELSELAILALSAEAVGALEVLYKDTVDYTKQREQFDQTLAEFQSVKHRMVEMFTETEQARSLLYRATMQKQSKHPEASLDIHALKYFIGKKGRFVSQNAVQLHGGMGQTEELRIGHYFLRLSVIDSQFGGTDHHLAAFASNMAVPNQETT